MCRVWSDSSRAGSVELERGVGGAELVLHLLLALLGQDLGLGPVHLEVLGLLGPLGMHDLGLVGG